MAEYRRITTLVNIFLQEIVNLSVVYINICIFIYNDDDDKTYSF